jgi:hypothetical protein
MKDQESIKGSWSEKPKVGVDNHTYTKKNIPNAEINIQTPNKATKYNENSTSRAYDHWEGEEANTTPMPIGRWLTLKEAMTYAKVKSPNTIKKWIAEGYIYANKRTGSWIIDRQSIDDWYLADK